MRGTGGLKSLPPPRPPAGPHLSWHRERRSAPALLRVSLAEAARVRGPGRPFFCRLGGAGRKEPPPRAQVSIPPRVGPAAGHTCQLERLQIGQPCKVSGVDWRCASLVGGFLLPFA